MRGRMTNKSLEIADAGERKEALDVSRSFIVQAPAGSGKTELLMQRFLKLLSISDKPEEALALTFTRKAAGEMQNRIIGAIERAKEGCKPCGPHEEVTLELARVALETDRRLGWDLLDNPGRLKVKTIDSFCSSITRQMPVLTGLGGNLSITEDPEEFYKEAALRTLSMVEDDSPDGQAVRKALKHLDNSVVALTKRLVRMLGHRDQWLRHIKRDLGDEDLRGLLERSLKGLIEDELGRIKSAIPAPVSESLPAFARYAGRNLLDSDSPIRQLGGIEEIPGPYADELPAWRGLGDLLLTKEGGVRKAVNKNCGFPPNGSEAKGMKEGFQELLDLIRSDARLIDSLKKIKGLPEPKLSPEDWEILDALIHLLPIAQRQLLEVFREQGTVDFQEVSLSALSALGTEDDPTDLMLALDLKIKHILVDEYQDTSRVQLELLKALTRGWTPGDGRTLFVVGDPMQSIYRFREADVGLFLDARINGIASIPLEPLTLKCNFRSQANIVDWVNSTFAGAFPSNEDIATGSITYSPSVSTRPAIEGAVPQVCLFEQRDDAAEARSIASIVKGAASGESVAILCRSRAHLDAVVSALKKEAIPFRAQQIDALNKRPAIQDLHALLRALHHPFDRVAWLAILRAPWCGLTKADLLRLCMGDRVSSVWEILNDNERLRGLSDDGAKRVEGFKDKLGKALALKGRIRPGGLLEGLWIDLGGPATVADDAETEDCEAFFDLVEDVTEAGEVCLERLTDKMEGLYASHGKKEGVNVDLMTVHKAKGLEFDHVILPGLGKKSRAADKKLVLWMERADGIIFAPMEKKGGEQTAVYGLLKSVDREKDELEMARVFYVAATRARRRLYLFGHINGIADDGIKVEKASFLAPIRRVLAQDMIIRNAAAEEIEAKARPMLKRLPSNWRCAAPAPPIDVGRPVKEVEAEPEFYWAGEAVKHLGTVVHGYLCAIARQGLDNWSAKLAEGQRQNIIGRLRALGLNMKDAKEASIKAVDIIKTALGDEKGRWILKGRAEAQSELALAGVVKNEVVHAVIDRTFVEDGVRWVIDYKTSLHEGGSITEFLENEKNRYRGQLERYQELLKKAGEELEIRKGLYYPALKKFIEF